MKRKIPKFKNIGEERKFWDKHSLVDYLGELKPAYMEFPKPKHILLSIRPKQITILNDIAFKKGISSSTLIRKWLTERISKEVEYLKA